MNTNQPKNNSKNYLTIKEVNDMINEKTNIKNLKKYIKSQQGIAETFCVYAILRNKDWTKGFHNTDEFLNNYHLKRALTVGSYTWEFLIFNEYKRLIKACVLTNISDNEINDFHDKLMITLQGES